MFRFYTLPFPFWEQHKWHWVGLWDFGKVEYWNDPGLLNPRKSPISWCLWKSRGCYAISPIRKGGGLPFDLRLYSYTPNVPKVPMGHGWSQGADGGPNGPIWTPIKATWMTHIHERQPPRGQKVGQKALESAQRHSSGEHFRSYFSMRDSPLGDKRSDKRHSKVLKGTPQGSTFGYMDPN